ncbi:MAG: endopeptidase La [Clostridia bacterium]|nr:endopeptidase La [Clostridia bacterium]
MSEATEKNKILPMVALRGLVVFPGMFLHFDVGRPKSVAAVYNAMNSTSREIFLVAQKDIGVEEPKQSDLYKYGVIATVSQILKISNRENGPVKVAVEGVRRAKLCEIINERRSPLALCEPLAERAIRGVSKSYIEALVRHTKELFDVYGNVAPQLPQDINTTVMRETNPGKLADFIAGNIMLEYQDRQIILENLSPVKRLEDMCVLLEREIELLGLEMEIQNKVQDRIDENQREYYLHEQIRAINEELGNTDEDETASFREKIYDLKAPDEVKQKLFKSCARLEKYSPQSPEAAVERNYIEAVLALPWGICSKDNLNLTHARKVLDDDHYGLEKVKDRIIELLAVRKLSPDITGQIICLAGPPGVGKTSVARSIADAMGRKYVRVSLGGVKDEAEIRGHRKTYIGSMPGRIIDAVQKAGTSNPLILLDEVDKLSSDYKGDPTSALLEVLDPEQNNSFRDHYIELPFDLSKVLFITTANIRDNIPEPLLDRMEIIELGSYTAEEKFQIAKRHLVKKQMKRHGLKAANLRITDAALRTIIDGYTREAGVRLLEQKIAAVCRKAAVNVANGGTKMTIKPENLQEILGSVKYKPDSSLLVDRVGAVNGLAWTTVGGEMLTVECAVLDGSGKLELTGSLGNVMQESAKAALSCIRARSKKLNIDPDFYKSKDIHLHFPEGAVPKDGPSAGVTITTALVSALSNAKVRGDIAMTGEITLRGRVLPIGGLKEKSMAAYRSGIKKVIIPTDNISDLDEVDPAVKSNVEFVPVSTVESVWSEAFANSDYLAPEGERIVETHIPEKKNGKGARMTQ